MVQFNRDGYSLRGESLTENIEPICFSLINLPFNRPTLTTLIVFPRKLLEPPLLIETIVPTIWR